MPTFLIGNWKMQLSVSESEILAKEIVANIPQELNDDFTLVLCPTSMAMQSVSAVIKGTRVHLGGQNTFWEEKGAYTGEASPRTLKELGCTYCIVGHSERRQYLGETDEMVNKKVKALIRDGICPIICVGETLEERQNGRRDAVVNAQVCAALADVALEDHFVIIAYEPRWVIGTGQAVAPSDAAEMHQLIHETLVTMFTKDFVEKQCAIIYGGAVDAKNIADFLAVDSIWGALVGGASLRSQEFVTMAKIANQRKK